MTSHQDNQKKLEQLKLKITNIAAALHEGLVGREEVIKVALLGVLSRENTILFGPPGTAKSEIARRISKVIGNGYFEYLLTKFTTPEEIFGPLSIAKLKQDQFERNTQGFLPTAQIGFLDEIFKANSSILNTLLTILNERIFHNGHTRQDVPLVSLISASNELPLNDNELSALYDRFLFKYVVDYLPESKIRQLFDISPSHNNKINQINFTQQDLDTVSANLGLVEIPDEIKDLMIEIRNQYNETFKEDKTETLSDRRFVKLIKIVKISALTNARMVVDQSDLLVLCHCLWNNPGNKERIYNLIHDFLFSERVKHNNIYVAITNFARGSYLGINANNYTINNPFIIENLQDEHYITLPQGGIEKGAYCKFVDCLTPDCVYSFYDNSIRFDNLFQSVITTERFIPDSVIDIVKQNIWL